ncbi:FDXR [Cordylochernes scorpioides]|uniref:FDXR n=1 Tax=Cordylochernes scorpioides TaxID=51811 RepID=A0ABY6LGZ0_9ARAC|nr:FDXR [Cordylochernes scorpioides]
MVTRARSKAGWVTQACVVGSGPAGFYTARQLLANPKMTVDMYEKFPVPFGLVRYGVAPDHPDVKKVINTFTKTGQDERFRFVGNVEVGRHVSLQQLLRAYNLVVLSYGSQSERSLGIPGESAQQCFSSRDFVGWYNGDFRCRDLPVDLGTDTVVVVGQGNIALDVSRVILSPTQHLCTTDITEHALAAIQSSKVKRVLIVGRRGPLQASFTTKELRDMTKMEEFSLHFPPADITAISGDSVPQKKKRIFSIMGQHTSEKRKSKTCEFLFYRSPLRILEENNRVTGVVFGVNRLEESGGEVRAVPTGETEEIKCGLVITSIGYKNTSIDPDIPFDQDRGVIQNIKGRVLSVPGLYCSGWVQRGPVGVIADTMKSSMIVGNTIQEDLQSGCCASDTRPGYEAIAPLLQEQGVQVVDFTDWLKVDQVETALGMKEGKPRTKLLSIEDILRTDTESLSERRDSTRVDSRARDADLATTFERRWVTQACVVGSGPAGFYTARQLLANPKMTVDMYEKFPVPFGLVRYGVAPDHPDVKKVINTFTKTGQGERFRFVGNVEVGRHVSLQQLLRAYNLVVLSYGSQSERSLGIPGESAQQCFSSRDFVGWYNGDFRCRDLPVDLGTDTVVVVGQGNIALDVSRVILSPTQHLRTTDITEHALAAIQSSKVKRVLIVGRRGPLQASFTTMELRDMTKIADFSLHFPAADITAISGDSVPQNKKRIFSIMGQHTSEKRKSKTCEFLFYRSPLRILEENNCVTGVVFGVNRLEESGGEVRAVPTGETEEIKCGLVITSIGYKNTSIDPDIPFDQDRGVIQNIKGRVLSVPGLYCSGWVQRGPVGVIADTKKSSIDVGNIIQEDLQSGCCPSDTRPGYEAIAPLLQEQGVQVVDFTDWLKVDQVETALGMKEGKPRTKLLSIEDILSLTKWVTQACVVGSGPAGFYTARQLLANPKMTVDMYEKFPVPFGLVRYGVAPDHPDVKKVFNTFTKTGQGERFRFVGNVEVGRHVSLQQLLRAYNLVVLSYGSQSERSLGIPGESAQQCFSSRDFVGWYNGDFRCRDLPVDLGTDTVVVVGQGNIALDVSRVILSPTQHLRTTDITEHALAAIQSSKVKRVLIVGRRGPLQASFTTMELRDMTKIADFSLHFPAADITAISGDSVPQNKKRIFSIMGQHTSEKRKSKTCEFLFYRSPLRILEENNCVTGVVFGVNRLEESGGEVRAVPTGETEEIKCGLVITSIGYKNTSIDPDIPFDQDRGVIQNIKGRVLSVPGLYCSGWVQWGPVGVIADTKKSSIDVGNTIQEDLQSGCCPSDTRPGYEAIAPLLQEQGVQVVDFTDWLKVDQVETALGMKEGKPRTKLLSIEDILSLTKSPAGGHS